jgi:hypothetical protein
VKLMMVFCPNAALNTKASAPLLPVRLSGPVVAALKVSAALP